MRIRPEDYSIRNAMEDVADQAIKQVLSEDQSACNCPLCHADLKCQILNNLPSRYHPLLADEPEPDHIRLEHLEPGLFNKIMIECYKALIRVKENPRHHEERVEPHNTTECMLRLSVSEILSNQKLYLERDDLSRLMAGALNGLTPSYTTTHKGDAFIRASQIDPAYLANVYSQIFKVLEGLPKHNRQTS